MKILIHTEKAKLLHQLFPEEIPLLLDDILGFCTDFITFQDIFREEWSGIFTFDLWLHYAVETSEIIKKNRTQMVKSSHVFSERLCATYAVFLVTDRIIKYSDKRSTDEKFKLAVDLFYK